MKLSPAQADIDDWVAHLLPAKDIYYLDGNYSPFVTEGVTRLSINELLAHPEFGSLAYNNAFEYWKLNKAQVPEALVAEPEWFAKLPMAERGRLFGLQVALNRGLVFGRDVLMGHAFAKMIEHAGVNGKLVFNHFLWNRLDLNQKQ